MTMENLNLLPQPQPLSLSLPQPQPQSQPQPQPQSQPQPQPQPQLQPQPQPQPLPLPRPQASAPPPCPDPKFTPHPEHKNHLQQYAQRSGIQLPQYQTINEGHPHGPKFRSTVTVDGVTYYSPNTFRHRKAAEQDVAKIALDSITKHISEEVPALILEDTLFCKSILNEFATKISVEKPVYTTIQRKGLLPVFTSALVFNGSSYNGEPAKTKKEAEQLAARAAINSILGASELKTTLSKIVMSKRKLSTALPKVQGSVHESGNAVALGADTGHGSVDLHGKDTEAVASVLPINKAPKVSNSGSSAIHHEFRLPHQEQLLQEDSSPVVSVPATAQQSLGDGCSKRRRRNKKKANKKPRTDALLPASTLNLNLFPPCSVVQ